MVSSFPCAHSETASACPRDPTGALGNQGDVYVAWHTSEGGRESLVILAELAEYSELENISKIIKYFCYHYGRMEVMKTKVQVKRKILTQVLIKLI